MKDERKRGYISAELSLWSLLTRSCFYKILAVLVLMTAAEGFLFCRALGTHGALLSCSHLSGNGLQDSGLPGNALSGGSLPGFERMIDESGMAYIFVAALGIIFFIFVCMEGMLERKSSCTLMRLRVTQWHLFWTKTTVNLLFLTVLFAAQIGVALFAARLYTQAAEPGRVMPQFLFLAFYSSSFLHCLLPMAHGAKWVRNVLILLAFSMEGGSGRWGNRERGKNYAQPVLLYVVIALWFVSSMDDYRDIICIIICCMHIATAIWSVYRKIERKHED